MEFYGEFGGKKNNKLEDKRVIHGQLTQKKILIHMEFNLHMFGGSSVLN